MRALLLAAGFGTRLRPITNTVPKALVPVDGRPLLDYWLRALFASGVDRVMVNLHYQADQVAGFLRESRFASRIDMVHEGTLLGTAGTLRAQADFVGDEPFILAHADNLCICDFSAFFDAHRHRPPGAEMTMMTFDAPDPQQCGIVKCDENGLVQEFHEKKKNPPGRRANAAVYVMEPSVTKFVTGLDLATPDISNDVIPHYMGRIFAWQNDGYHIDIGTLQTYGLAQIDVVGYREFMRERGWF